MRRKEKTVSKKIASLVLFIIMLVGCAEAQPPAEEKDKKDPAPPTAKKKAMTQAEKIKAAIEDGEEVKVHGVKFAVTVPRKAASLTVEAVVKKETTCVIVMTVPKGTVISASQPLALQWSWTDREGTVWKPAQEYVREWRAERETVITISLAQKD